MPDGARETYNIEIRNVISSSFALFLLEGSELSPASDDIAQEAGAVIKRALVGSKLCSEANCAKKGWQLFSVCKILQRTCPLLMYFQHDVAHIS